MSEKIKVTLDGTAETMLQSFYARAKYSLKKGHNLHPGLPFLHFSAR